MVVHTCNPSTWEAEVGEPRVQDLARCRWFTPVILATQEAEIRRISVQSQPSHIVSNCVSEKTFTKKAGGVVQGEGPKFKPQYCQKRRKELKAYLGYIVRPCLKKQTKIQAVK
jgi:hypothetical protein